MTKKVITGLVQYTKHEDGGQALLVDLDFVQPREDNGMFVILQSWDETGKHTELTQYLGRRVRITVEVIE